jgi:2-C-methyl-D-erythritol 4-phosphate cytidylyltransferase
MGGDLPKQFIEVAGKPIVIHTISKFLLNFPGIKVILVLPKEHMGYWSQLKEKFLREEHIIVVEGGETRFDSVENGLMHVEGEGIVAIHDAVRPCVSSQTLLNAFSEAEKEGSAVVSVKLKDSIRRVTGEKSKAEDRSEFRIVQTPQIFEIGIIKKAFENASSNLFTDDASVVESNGLDVKLVEGNYENIKVTTPEDLQIAEVFLRTVT